MLWVKIQIMEVYVETVFLDNLILDFIILYFSAILTKEKIKWWRLFLASVFGGGFVFLYIFLSPSPFFGLVLKGLSLVAILGIAFSFSGFFKKLGYFLAMTFLIGGAGIGIVFLLKGRVVGGNFLFYSGEIPMFPFFLIIFFGFVVAKKFVISISKRRKFSGFLHDVILIKGEKQAFLKGFLDSGNFLEKGGRGVSVVYFGKVSHIDLSEKKKVTAEFASGSGHFYHVGFDKMVIISKDKTYTVLAPEIFITTKSFKDFHMLLSPQCFE